jgi:hypothetical protein
MNQPSDHATPGWLHLLALIALGSIAIVLWTPAPDPPPSPEQESKIADLAERLGSASATASDIDARLRSLGPFPPDAQASRALAEALIGCETSWLDETRRTQLARHLYGVAVIGDDRAKAVPAALLGIQQTITGGGLSCAPGTVDSVVNAARAVATTDPNPRRNWW